MTHRHRAVFFFFACVGPEPVAIRVHFHVGFHLLLNSSIRASNSSRHPPKWSDLRHTSCFACEIAVVLLVDLMLPVRLALGYLCPLALDSQIGTLSLWPHAVSTHTFSLTHLVTHVPFLTVTSWNWGILGQGHKHTFGDKCPLRGLCCLEWIGSAVEPSYRVPWLGCSAKLINPSMDKVALISALIGKVAFTMRLACLILLLLHFCPRFSFFLILVLFTLYI